MGSFASHLAKLNNRLRSLIVHFQLDVVRFSALNLSATTWLYEEIISSDPVVPRIAHGLGTMAAKTKAAG